jgi:hypothetical protein
MQDRLDICKTCIHTDMCERAYNYRQTCENFLDGTNLVRQQLGVWKDYSSTMMECSVCSKHVPYHKYKYCPNCGVKIIESIKLQSDEQVDWEPKESPLHTGRHGQ